MSPLASAMLGDQQRMPPLASMVMANAGPAPSIDAASAPAPADAWSQNASAVQDWLAQQRAQSARMGLWNDQTGLPTQAGVMDAARQYANAIQPATIRAFHGSPYDFSAFDMGKIGAGEGAQAYGHGLYFAGNERVAQGYRDKLAPLGIRAAMGSTEAQGVAARLLDGGSSPEDAILELQGRAQAPHLNNLPPSDAEAFRQKMQDAIAWIRNPSAQGRMYEVNLNVEPGQLLDYDKPFMDQPQAVQDALTAKIRALQDRGEPMMSGYVRDVNRGTLPGGGVYMGLGNGTAEGASEAWRQAGIPGIQYLDGGSRTAGEGTRNYVMFDPNLIDIVRKYGLAGAMLGAPAAAPFMPSQAPQQ